MDVPALDRKKGYEFAPGKIKVGEAPQTLLATMPGVPELKE